MKNLFILTLFATLGVLNLKNAYSQSDSIVIQTFVFDSIHTRSGTFQFPPEQQWERVLMHYTLKCDPRTPWDRFDCGEWDYLTYTIVRDSSGRFDSTNLSQAKFTVRNSVQLTYKYTDQPTYNIFRSNYRKYSDFTTANLNKINDFSANIENMTLNSNDELNTIRKRYVYTNSELNALGLSAGTSIKAVRIKLNDPNDFAVGLDNAKIKLNLSAKSVNVAIPSRFEDYKPAFNSANVNQTFADLREYFIEGNELILMLNNPYTIIQNTNLFVDFIIELPNDAQGEIIDAYFETENNNNVLIAETKGAYLDFSRGDLVNIPTSELAAINKELTVALWLNGNPQVQPFDSYLFEGWDSNGRRVINVHLPWGNSRVYWDCGNAGTSNYDRIEKDASFSDFAGKWNHWVFTKNVNTGIMNIYLNGELWHTGVDKFRELSDIVRFHISSNGRYAGKIDEFSIWNTELSATDVGNLYESSIINNSGDFNTKFAQKENNLLVYYKFDEYINNNKIMNLANNTPSAVALGMPALKKSDENDILTDISRIGKRLAIVFDNSEYTSQYNDIIIEHEIQNPPTTVLLFNHKAPNRVVPVSELDAVTRQMRTPTDTLMVWNADVYTFTYNAEGNKVDSTYIEPNETLELEYLNWYSPIVDYEIERFITPYGINLDLGPEGFTWIYDVTDFAPLLSDWVWMSSANTQELVDLKFIFIKGTPARDINKLQYIWKQGGSSAQIKENIAIPPTDIKLDENSKMFRVKTRSSGHGFAGGENTYNCGEFCPRLHNLWINGNKIYEWDGWQECGDNPVYPQGGTWLLDRADWCPSKEVNTYNHEITEFVTPGETVNFNYYMEEPGPNAIPYGNYVFTGYLMSYGDYNFDIDAAMTDILAPSTDRRYSRFNPICNNPIVEIQNTGRQTINSIKFEYGVAGEDKMVYLWEGEVKSLNNEQITLPLIPMPRDGSHTFEVTILEVNGDEDEYKRNNYAHSTLHSVAMLGNPVEIIVFTNQYADQQYELHVIRDDGTVVFHRPLGQFVSSKLKIDTLDLEFGCYEMIFVNHWGYGLDYWPIRDQIGSGSITIRSGAYSNRFVADFGNSIRYQFRVGPKPQAQTDTKEIYLDSVNTEKTIKIFPTNEAGLMVSKIDIVLGTQKGFSYTTSPDITQGAVYLALGDTMDISVRFTPPNSKQQKATMLITTNDFTTPTQRVDIYGNYDGTSVLPITTHDLELKLSHNPVTDYATVTYFVNSPLLTEVELAIYDLLGNKIESLFNGQMQGAGSQEINTQGFGSGRYFLILKAGGAIHKTIPLIISK